MLKVAATVLLCSALGISQVPQPATQPPAQAVPVQPVPTLPKPQPPFYRNLIVIDPAHGGADHGAQLGSTAEKDVTLAFAQRLRTALAAQGFTVVSTRDSDPADALSSDQRAGVANHARPLACLVLHATAAGSGIHLATSSLEPSRAAVSRAMRWSEAQAPVLNMSLRLENEIGLVLSNARLPVTLLRASVPPIDNLICAATVIEIAPPEAKGSSASDVAYQQRIAEAVAAGLANFRTHNAPPPSSVIPATPVSVPSPTGRPASPAPPSDSGQAPSARPSAAPQKGAR